MEIIMVAVLFLLFIGLFLVYFHELKFYLLLKQRLDRVLSPFMVILNREDQVTKESHRKKTYLSFARIILNQLHVLTAETTKLYTKRLANAGWLSRNALIIFMSFRVLSFFLALFLGIVLILLVPWISSQMAILRLLLVIIMLLLGFKIPDWYLKNRTKKFRIALRRSVMDFMDLFLICIEAGFSNDKALTRVNAELRLLHPELTEQVNVLITELSILPERRQAWENFAERTGVEEIKIIVQIINQSEQLGTSIGQALRGQVEMFRSERLGLVEQKAMRLPTLLTLPLVIFILPALLLVILGPAVLKALEIFGK